MSWSDLIIWVEAISQKLVQYLFRSSDSAGMVSKSYDVLSTSQGKEWSLQKGFNGYLFCKLFMVILFRPGWVFDQPRIPPLLQVFTQWPEKYSETTV